MKSDPVSSVAILLVDDNPNGLTARRIILEEQGFTVTGSENAEDAWTLFQQTRFDIVITDYRLKGMNGGDLIRLIRDSDSPARVILLSGFIGVLGLSEENTGADELILKSNKEVPELLRAVRKLAHQTPRRRPPSPAKPARTRLVNRKSAGQQ
jgi:two-component system, NtrC family, response regulator HydG